MGPTEEHRDRLASVEPGELPCYTRDWLWLFENPACSRAQKSPGPRPDQEPDTLRRGLCMKTPGVDPPTPAAASPSVHYPESDGKPVGETDFHITVIFYLRQALRHFFRRA